MPVIEKLLKYLKARPKAPFYTRRQFILKAINIYICYLGQDFAGTHIYSLEVKYAHNQISAYQAFYSPMVLYYYLIAGFCLANAFWKLLEIYWYGKDRVAELRLNKRSEKPMNI